MGTKWELIFIFFYFYLHNNRLDFFLIFLSIVVFIILRLDFSFLPSYLLSFISLFSLLFLLWSLRKFLKFILHIVNLFLIILPCLSCKFKSYSYRFSVPCNLSLSLLKHEFVLLTALCCHFIDTIPSIFCNAKLFSKCFLNIFKMCFSLASSEW